MKLNVDKKAVGSRIKTIRLDRGLTLEEFGKLFNASFGNVKSWEMGNSLPNAERINLICKIANITRNELLYGSVEELIKNNEYIISKGLCIKTDNVKRLINIINNYYEDLKIDLNNINDIDNFIKYLGFRLAKIKLNFNNNIDYIKYKSWDFEVTIPFDLTFLEYIDQNSISNDYVLEEYSEIQEIVNFLFKHDSIYQKILETLQKIFRVEDLKELEIMDTFFTDIDFLQGLKSIIEKKIQQLEDKDI